MFDHLFHQYVSSRLTSLQNPLTKAIEEETTRLFPQQTRMLCGQQVGGMLKLIARITKPHHIVEIGTFTGYSTSFLLDGNIDNNNIITTIDNNLTYQQVAQRMLSQHKQYQCLHFVYDEAVKALQAIKTPINMAFIDANKRAYKTHYSIIKEKMPTGGIIIIDNVLFHGEVYKQCIKKNTIAFAIDTFNQYVAKDEEIEGYLFNIRDGLWVIRKK